MMTNFRRSAIHNTTQKPKGKGGGNWYDAMRLPQNAATPFVFINSEYVDHNPPQGMVEMGPDGRPLPVKNSYYKYQVHRRKLMKNGREWFADEPCSKGTNPHDPKPCAGCMAMDMGDKSVTLSDKFVFGIVHLVPYHTHPLYDRQTGKVRMRQDNSAPIFGFADCTGRSCNFCRVQQGQSPVVKPGEFWPNYNPSDIKTDFGHRRYLEIGKSHLSNLEGWEDGITNLCSSHVYSGQQLLGKCGQQLILDSYNCPTCSTVLIDLNTDPRHIEEIENEAKRPYPCKTCNRYVMLKEISSCDACTQQGRTAVQLSVLEVVLWGKRQGEGTKSQLMLQQYQTIEEFGRSVAMNPQLAQILAGRSVSDIIKQLGTPYDFDKIFGARSFEDQARRLELNIQAPVQQSAYGQQSFAAPAFSQPQQSYVQEQAAPQYPAQAQQQQFQQQFQQPQAVPYPGPTPFQVPQKPNFSK